MQTNKLTMLINAYAHIKAKVDEEKKDLDSRNKEIKELMKQEDIDSFDTGVNTAKFTVQRRESINEDKLIKVLQNAGFDGKIVKLKPYVDMDELESAIYHDQLSEEVQRQVQDCITVKEVETLRVSTSKGVKE